MNVTRPTMADRESVDPDSNPHHRLTKSDRRIRAAGVRKPGDPGDGAGHLHDPSSPRELLTRADRVPIAQSEGLNRVLNLVLAVGALVVFAPVLVLIAVAIRLTTRGPIVYTQVRVGIDHRYDRDRRLRTERRRGADRRIDLDRRRRVDRRAVLNRRGPRAAAALGRRRENIGGNPFRIYKFRSMYDDAECGTGAVWATPCDSRVTPLGSVLRKLRLDELPQLVNVVKGDMNIVGPRPERPSIFSVLRDQIPEYPLRQRARPGITGWAQITHPYDMCVDDVRTKVDFDLEYLERRTVWEDLRIMVKTIPVVLFGRGGW